MNFRRNIISFLIYLYIILLPLIPSKFKYKNIPFNGDIILALIILLYVFQLVFLKETRKRFIEGIKDLTKDYFNISIIILLFIMYLSIGYASSRTLAIKETFRFTTYIALYFIIKYEISSKRIIDNIIRCYISVSLLISFIGVYQYIGGKGFVQKHGSETLVRIVSTLENSNNVGMFFILAVFPLIMLTLYEKEIKKKIFYGLTSFLFFINIILSFSRNAWLGFAIGCFILVLIYSIKLLFLFGGVGILALFLPPVFSRIKQIDDMSQNISRIKLWKTASIMIKDNPIFGVGNGNFAALYDSYITKYPDLRYCSYKVYHPHNIFLKIQSELGIIGLVGFIGMIISIGFKLKKFINIIKDNFYKAFYSGVVASMVAFLFMNIVDNFFSAPKVIAYFWIILSISDNLLYNRFKYNITN
ncbi:O-antigen ligase [Clostridium acetireducens DSM 10703]|uniref:O-antigen ligase n=1 Tax=Clostridium acetireducens DSM 10703 TaxID=1121290 RepID=A0A1E8EXX8_9CLOT|nr:O-antigen ligase family protein [Clostridium acetireducens]OFI05795.1 O-antigen ligase [Clostridium acetireducens DSM 10703]